MCAIIGLRPILSPPGRGTLSFLNLAKRGPINSTETLIFSKRLNGIFSGLILAGLILIFLSESHSIFTPICFKISIWFKTSETKGRLSITELFSERRTAAKIAPAEFLYPQISTSPERWVPP